MKHSRRNERREAAKAERSQAVVPVSRYAAKRQAEAARINARKPGFPASVAAPQAQGEG